MKGFKLGNGFTVNLNEEANRCDVIYGGIVYCGLTFNEESYKIDVYNPQRLGMHITEIALDRAENHIIDVRDNFINSMNGLETVDGLAISGSIAAQFTLLTLYKQITSYSGDHYELIAREQINRACEFDAMLSPIKSVKDRNKTIFAWGGNG